MESRPLDEDTVLLEENWEICEWIHAAGQSLTS